VSPNNSGRIASAPFCEHSRQKGLSGPVDRARVAEHPRPDHVIAHISDTHLVAGDGDLYGDVDAEGRLSELLERLEASQTRPDALIFTGDLADKGQPDAYRKLRNLVEPLADRLGAEVIWVMGNHDNRAALREHLLRGQLEALVEDGLGQRERRRRALRGSWSSP